MHQKIRRLPDIWPKERYTRGLLFVSGITVLTNLTFGIVVVALFDETRLAYLLGAHAIAGLLVALYVLAKGPLERWKVLLCDITLLTPAFISIWESHLLAQTSGILFDQLFAPKILMLGWALFVPSSRLMHIAYLAGLGVESALIWNDMSQSAKAPFVPAEPSLTALAFLVGLVYIVTRWRKEKFEQELIALRAKTLALTEVAHVFLRIRDLANTPLQNLLLIVERLERGEAASPRMVAIIRRSLEKINALHAEFNRYEDRIEWPEETADRTGDKPQEYQTAHES